MIGTRLGQYEIIEELGKGGMATVFRAYQPSMERFVAVKVIHRALATDALGLERFRREARLIARLEHPHLLPVYDYDPQHDPPYIVMRYLEGGTLRDVLDEQRKLPPAEIAHLLKQIASALDYAHRQGVIHRDIKPSNIMIDQDGNAYLADFGIARISGGQGMTQTGFSVGTPGYMAPEQGMGQEVDLRADIYALGVMLFEMATGKLPYDAPTPMAVILEHIQRPVPSILAVNPKLPAGFEGIIEKALAKAPADRYASAGELASDLVEAIGTTANATPRTLRTAAQRAVQEIQARREEHADDLRTVMQAFELQRSTAGNMPDEETSMTPSAPQPIARPDAATTAPPTAPASSRRGGLLVVAAVVAAVAVLAGVFLFVIEPNNRAAEASATAAQIALLATEESATQAAEAAATARAERRMARIRACCKRKPPKPPPAPPPWKNSAS